MPSREEENVIDLREAAYNVVQDLLHSWALILWVGVAAALIGDLVISLVYTPMYRAEATFVMKQSAWTMEDTEAAEVAEAFDYILGSNVFIKRIKEEIGVTTLNGSFSSEIIPGTYMIKVRAEADGPRQAYQMMHAMMDRYQEISRQVIGDTQIDVIDQIEVPKAPYNGLSHLKNLLIFGGAGAGATILLLAVLSYIKDTVKGRRDITEKLHIRYLGSIAVESKLHFRRGRIQRKKSILLTQLSTSFEYIEEVKKIRSRLERSAQRKGYQVLMVTSSVENEGKSSVVGNLALSLAENGKRILVADMDFRKPAIYKMMDLKKNNGIQDALEKKRTWREALFHEKKSGIDYLLKYGYEENAAHFLEGSALQEILKEARREYDYILLDSAPVTYMSDAVLLSRNADAVLFVVRQNFAPLTLVNRAIDKVMLTGTPVLGAVLNQGMRKKGRE